ncbi:MAG: hypothetical protein IGS48_14315, partial [Oscillatoriales cyanobacterium C42_A2020_001]|nr:hypothetical protein [Leptolyngbyaceae cyanobacterium C42_A2020_001]
MYQGSPTAHTLALQVIQQAVDTILNWAAGQDTASTQQPHPLQLVFDRIHLGHGQAQHHPQNYRPASILKIDGDEQYPRIPYATQTPPTDLNAMNYPAASGRGIRIKKEQ